MSSKGIEKVIKAARLIDCTDGSVRENMAVVVENGRISRISSQYDLAFPEGAQPEVLDFGDATLLPGLIDCHTHTNMPGDGTSVDAVHEDDDGIHLIQAVKSARLAIESGVTTMRENGGWNRSTFSVKEGIRRGLVPGPRIVNCGRPITMTGGHCWMMGSQADGVEGVRKEVRKLVAEGADYIKVMTSGGSTRNTLPSQPSYSLDELKAIVDEAHLRGRPVGAHANAVQAIANCLDAGVDMIIHCTFLHPDGSIGLDRDLPDRIVRSGVCHRPAYQPHQQTLATRTIIQGPSAKERSYRCTSSEGSLRLSRERHGRWLATSPKSAGLTRRSKDGTRHRSTSEGRDFRGNRMSFMPSGLRST